MGPRIALQELQLVAVSSPSRLALLQGLPLSGAQAEVLRGLAAMLQ
jgi:hypothetical protein